MVRVALFGCFVLRASLLCAAIAPGTYQADAVPCEKGSIELWVTPLKDGCTPDDHVYFADGDSWGKEGTPTIWYWSQYIRFDVDGGKRLVYGRLPDGILEPGIPVQIVACWDAKKGETAVYANGALVQKREVEPWQALKLSRYVVGSDCRGRRKAGAVVDSLVCSAMPLTPEEISRRFAARSNMIAERRRALPRYRPKSAPSPARTAPVWKRVSTIDPYAEEPVATLGRTERLDLPCGHFRATVDFFDPKNPYKHDRFAYVRELPDSNLLVRVTLTYPDDTNRTLMVSQTQPDFGWIGAAGAEQQVLGSGVMTGKEFPNSGKALRYEYVFRHPSKHLGLVFESPQRTAPGAIGPVVIEVAEAGTDRYGPAAQTPMLMAKNHRRAGLYWEDPVLSMTFGGFGGTDDAEYDRDLVNAMDYFSWCGVDLFFYPTVWYNGPIYRSSIEKGTWPNGMRHHPADFPELFARRCSERGIRFVSDFAMSRLPSLAARFGTKEQVLAGDTNVLNVVWADGTIPTTGYMYKPPIYNALRREVQDAVAALVEEHCDRLASEPSFGGVSLYLNHWNPAQCGLWLDGSYDDWTMSAFARQIGEPLPGKPDEASRFAVRAKWICENQKRREAFLAWRAEIVTGFYERLAARISARKPDAKLYLRLDTPSISLMNTSAGAFWKPYSSEAFREMGLDLGRLAKNPAIVLDRLFSWGIVRCERNYHPDSKLTGPFDDLTPAFQRELLVVPGSVGAATVHQYYFETHGEIKRKRMLDMPKPWTCEAPGRCVAPLYPGRWPLLYYAKALELFDVKELSMGGYTLGTHGIESLVREWTLAFRSLPAVSFKEVSRKDDVVLRTAEAEGFRWWYLLNTASEDRKVDLCVSGNLFDAVSNMPLVTGVHNLRAFDLLVVRGHQGDKVDFVQTKPSPNRVIRGGSDF